MTVVRIADAEEDSGRRAGETRRRDARVFECFPGRLQQQPLLRVHMDRFSRRDPEELGIELLGSVDKTAPARVHLSSSLWVAVVKLGAVPPRSWDLLNGVDAFAQKLPVGIRAFDSAGQPAADAYDRERHSTVLLRRLHALVQLIRKQRETLW